MERKPQISRIPRSETSLVKVFFRGEDHPTTMTAAEAAANLQNIDATRTDTVTLRGVSGFAGKASVNRDAQQDRNDKVNGVVRKSSWRPSTRR